MASVVGGTDAGEVEAGLSGSVTVPGGTGEVAVDDEAEVAEVATDAVPGGGSETAVHPAARRTRNAVKRMIHRSVTQR